MPVSAFSPRFPRLLLGLAIVMLLASGLAVPPDSMAKAKVTLCHRVGGPDYIAITVAPEAVFGNGNGHAGTHPLDIIPAFTYQKGGRVIRFPGQNLSPQGVAILGGGCVPPLPAAPGGGDDGGGNGNGNDDPGRPPADPGDPQDDRITICHWLGDGEYREERLGLGEAVTSHEDHERDIIPVFTHDLPSGPDAFPGRNLTAEGIAILDNDCVPPGIEDIARPGEADLDVTKSAVDLTAATLVPGDEVRFRLVIRNDGSVPADDVVVRDAVPAGTTAVAGSATTTAGVVEVVGGRLVAELGTLAAGATETVEFTVRVDDDVVTGAVVLNRAEAAGSDGTTPLEADSNLVELPVDVPPPAPARITVDVPDDPTPGSDVRVTYEATPVRDLDDVVVCATIMVPKRGALGYARTTCAKPRDVRRGVRVRIPVRVRVPRFAAGRCIPLMGTITADGHSPRERNARLCVARVRPEPVTG